MAIFMKAIIAFCTIVLLLFLGSCAATVEDMSPVRSGDQALIKGKAGNFVAQLLIPIGLHTEAYIYKVDDKKLGTKNSSLPVEVLVTPGKHELVIACGFRLDGGDYFRKLSRLEIDVRGGFVYQVNIGLQKKENVSLSLKNWGLWSSESNSL